MPAPAGPAPCLVLGKPPGESSVIPGGQIRYRRYYFRQYWKVKLDLKLNHVFLVFLRVVYHTEAGTSSHKYIESAACVTVYRWQLGAEVSKNFRRSIIFNVIQ